MPPSEIWTRAERSVVDGDAPTLDALLRDHGDLLRAGPVQSSWWGGLAPDYTAGDGRAIIAREHHVESWDEFANLTDALKDPVSQIAQFEAAVDAVAGGDVAGLGRVIATNPDLVRARSRRTHHATLLHYVGANGVEGFRQRIPTNAVEIAEILVDAGADVDATADMYGGGPTTLGLVATSIHPATAGVQEDLMAFLLARGASVGTAKGIEAWSSLINGCHANGRGRAAHHAPVDIKDEEFGGTPLGWALYAWVAGERSLAATRSMASCASWSLPEPRSTKSGWPTATADCPSRR
jgi:hypothetical protein